MSEKIAVYQPSLHGNESKYVNECLNSTWISSKGSFVDKFEKAFSEYIDVAHSISVCNGTVALHLALEAAGIGVGDEIIVPSLTYIASANAIKYTGANPVFVDVDINTWQMSPDCLSKSITKNTRAVVVVHLYGQACNMKDIVSICKKHDLLIIEDCAEALGTFYDGKHVGTFGDISTFSFYGNKTITTGEGGMVCTRNAALHKRALKLRNQGLADGKEYMHDVIGYNYRMTNICAAIGLAQLERIKDILAMKRTLYNSYSQKLDGLPLILHSEAENTIHSFWMVNLLLDDAEHRDPLRAHLLSFGIETRPVFNPIHSMPPYRSVDIDLPITSTIAARGISLPSWPELQEQQISFISSKIRQFFSI